MKTEKLRNLRMPDEDEFDDDGTVGGGGPAGSPTGDKD